MQARLLFWDSSQLETSEVGVEGEDPRKNALMQ